MAPRKQGKGPTLPLQRKSLAFLSLRDWAMFSMPLNILCLEGKQLCQLRHCCSQHWISISPSIVPGMHTFLFIPYVRQHFQNFCNFAFKRVSSSNAPSHVTWMSARLSGHILITFLKPESPQIIILRAKVVFVELNSQSLAQIQFLSPSPVHRWHNARHAHSPF